MTCQDTTKEGLPCRANARAYTEPAPARRRRAAICRDKDHPVKGLRPAQSLPCSQER